MRILINGNHIDIPEQVETVEQLSAHLQIANPHMIVEHNGDILTKSAHSTAKLADGDKVEMVQFVGGG